MNTGVSMALMGPLVAVLATACAPLLNAPGKAIQKPQLSDDRFIANDGTILPVRRWGPEKSPARAVLIALHGFNDYSNFFDEPGKFLSRHGIRSYAYDQRGFGASPGHGLWPGTQGLTGDLKQFTRLVRERHPGVPLYLLGESMGGAVIMVAATDPDGPSNALKADGIILAAPAVWGRITMPWYQRLALWLSVRIMPGATLTGQGLRIMASDNIEMLRALGRDELVIKATRVDAIHGLTNLMDEALDRAARFDPRALILYGRKDEVIPKKPTRLMLGRLPAAARQRVAVYKNGYHMLLRDLAADVIWKDIVHWIDDAATPLPSGAEKGAGEWIKNNDH